MIPPSPIQFTLWGPAALYTELAAGLWWALAAPWLQPGWPGSACTPDRHRAPAPASAHEALAHRAPAASPAARRPTIALAKREGRPRSPVEASERRVIEVPRGRWQRRRADREVPPTEG